MGQTGVASLLGGWRTPDHSLWSDHLKLDPTMCKVRENEAKGRPVADGPPF
jgi:hypothetical protein